MYRSMLLALLVMLVAGPAHAELRRSSPDAALIEHRYEIAAPPAAAWEALIHPERWWPQDHNWSGDSANMSLVPAAGGCFCERWEGGSVEHGRVIMAVEPRLLRFEGALGPLQEMAVTAVMTVALSPTGSGTEAIVTYRISGDASHGLDRFVAIVDEVVGQQFGAFAAHAARQEP